MENTYNASNPPRPLQVLSLGYYRTGSHSMKEALSMLGYRDVWHSSAVVGDVAESVQFWRSLGRAADDNMACLPTYTGKPYGRAEWDAIFPPCEALTDLTPFSESLIRAYPDAKVILVHRDIDSWFKSYYETLIVPMTGWTAWLSGWYMEPLIGLDITQTVWKFYMGLGGVSTLRNATDKNIMKIAYERHYDLVRRLVPPSQLLECRLGDGWEPLCDFLDKPVPKEPFPRLNESKVYREHITKVHRGVIRTGLLKLSVPFVLGGAALWLASWVARNDMVARVVSGWGASLAVTDEVLLKTAAGGGTFAAAMWWAIRWPLVS